MDKAQLIYCIMRGYTIDVVDMIIEEIHKIIILEATLRGTAKPQGFPILVTCLLISV